MRPEKFILNVINAYREARIPVVKDKKINRGRSRSVSAIAEDLFAEFLVKNDKSIEKIFVDQAIRLDSAKVTIYPDIAVVKNGEIVAFMDLKMDMGWKRKELVNLCNKHAQTIKDSKGTACRLKDGQTKDVQEFKISKKVSYSIVIVSRRNSGNLLGTLRDEVKKLNNSVHTFLLCNSSKYHPNSYSIEPKELLKQLEVNEPEFGELLGTLR
jgi:hypothetical protein